jgi:hypothetical protein
LANGIGGCGKSIKQLTKLSTENTKRSDPYESGRFCVNRILNFSIRLVGQEKPGTEFIPEDLIAKKS